MTPSTPKAAKSVVHWFRFQPFQGRGEDLPLLYGMRFRFSPTINTYMKGFNALHKYPDLPRPQACGWLAKSKCWYVEEVAWAAVCAGLGALGYPFEEIERPQDVEHFGVDGKVLVGVSLDASMDSIVNKLQRRIEEYEEKSRMLDSLIGIARIEGGRSTMLSNGTHQIDISELIVATGDRLLVTAPDGRQVVVGVHYV